MTMTEDDIKLLEIAAKAFREAGGFADYVNSHSEEETEKEWNPLEDDGDALRLAVKLNILQNSLLHTRTGQIMWKSLFEGTEQSWYKAYRRAIVELAAEGYRK